MDLSNVLPGFSFASDAPKAAIASKNLCNGSSAILLIVKIMSNIWLLSYK